MGCDSPVHRRCAPRFETITPSHLVVPGPGSWTRFASALPGGDAPGIDAFTVHLAASHHATTSLARSYSPVSSRSGPAHCCHQEAAGLVDQGRVALFVRVLGGQTGTPHPPPWYTPPGIEVAGGKCRGGRPRNPIRRSAVCGTSSPRVVFGRQRAGRDKGGTRVWMSTPPGGRPSPWRQCRPPDICDDLAIGDANVLDRHYSVQGS
jgi:hypothetical protein